MKTKLAALWDAFRSSYWFVPLLMTAGAAGLAFGMTAVDEHLQARADDAGGWIYTGGPAGARAVLSTVAASMITVAGVSFSITIVALTLASSQFGPRLLRNFMRDRGNQIVLGTFIATFSYCLLVLWSVREGNGTRFVPQASITLAIIFALCGIGVLIYFIHHVSTSIQADNVIVAVCTELHDAIRRLLPEPSPHADGDNNRRVDERTETEFATNGRAVEATSSGYLQAIDYDGLAEIASGQDVVLRAERRAGDFVLKGGLLVTVSPAGAVDRELIENINERFIMGAQRSPVQDVEFAIAQLVEVAVRALSPGVNDPFTAMTCIDRLGVAVAEIAQRDIPTDHRYGTDGTMRVIARRSTFAGITDAAFNQIRQYGRSSVAVSLRLLETIAAVAPTVRAESQREALRRHAAMMRRASLEHISEEADRQTIEERYETAIRALGGDTGAQLPA